MKRLIAFLLTLIIFGCKNISADKKTEKNEVSELSEKNVEENEVYNFKEYLDEENQYPLKKLNRKPISELKNETLRVWKYPGGGAVFEYMIEFRKSNSELTLHSYVLEDYENEKKFEKLNFSKTIRDKEVINQLISITSDSSFIGTEDSEKYCEPFWGCADMYYVEFTNGKKVNKFIINHNIDKCENEKAENSKTIVRIMNSTKL